MKTKLIVAATTMFVMLGAGAASATDLPTLPSDAGEAYHSGESLYPLTDAAGWTQETCEAAGLRWAETFCFTAVHYDGNAEAVVPEPTQPVAVPEVVPAVPEAVPAPVTVPTVPEAVPTVPEAAAVPYNAPPTELAYTGAEDVALGVAGVAFVGLGAFALVRARRMA